jgi:hypothetical protein
MRRDRDEGDRVRRRVDSVETDAKRVSMRLKNSAFLSGKGRWISTPQQRLPA